MNDQPRRPGTPGDEDLGEPIAQIAELRSPVPRGLRDRIRNSIRRRHFTADLTDFSLKTTLAVFLEYLTAAFEAFTGSRSTDRNRDP